MIRRRFVLATLAVLATPQAVRAQTTTGGCTVGFVNGILQFDPNCSTLTIPGLSFNVAPPSHLIPTAADDGTTSSTNLLQQERIERLQKHRAKKRRKQDRQQGKHDTRRNQRSRKRDNRHNQRVRQRAGTDATVSGNGPGLSSSFELEAGLYYATATFTANDPPDQGEFVATLLGPSGFTNKVFSLTPTSSGSNTYQAAVNLPERGSYLWDVGSADGKWALSLAMA